MLCLKTLTLTFTKSVDDNIFQNFLSIHCIESVVIHLHASTAEFIDRVSWENFDNIVPDRSESVLAKFDLRIQLRNVHLGKARRKALAKKLPKLVSRKLLFFWDELL